MLARRTTLKLRTGVVADTPRLVPAFSSKGFGFIKAKGDKQEYSEVTNALELIGPYIQESILISAYDLHHRYFRKPERFYRSKELLFIDSGGYELAPEWDSTEPVQAPYKGKGFDEEDYRKILQKLPKDLPFVIANYDWGTRGKTIEDQIIAAQELFNEFPRSLHNFLVKPTQKKKYLDIDDLASRVRKLQAFDILGVTEKELGKNILDRLVNLSRLRAAMDREHVEVPIHVWGGLDPLLSPMYFFAGAEIFDGVSWLRYAYHEGVAVYRDSYSILDLGIETPLDHVRGLVLNHNITFMQRLTTSLRRFVDQESKDFSMFNKQAEYFERAYRTLCTKVPELKGGV